MNHTRETRVRGPNLGLAVALGLMACLAAAGAILAVVNGDLSALLLQSAGFLICAGGATWAAWERKQAFEQYEMERDVVAFDAAMAEDDGTRVTLEQVRRDAD